MTVKLSEFEQAVLNNRLRLIQSEPAIDARVQREMRRLYSQWEDELIKIVGSKSRMTSTQVADLRRKLVTLRGNLTKLTRTKIQEIERQTGIIAKATHTGEVFKHTQMVGNHVAKFEGRAGVSFSGLNKKAIDAAYRQSFPKGTLKDIFGSVAPATARRLRRDIADAIAKGWTVDELARNWKNNYGAMGLTANAAKAQARTMVMQASSNAQLYAYSQQTDLIKGVQWEATFDSRTCPVCAGRHGRQYASNESPPQPAHLNCRCTWLPVFLDEALNTKLDTRMAYKRPDNVSLAYKQQSREFDRFLRDAGSTVQREFFPSRLKMRAWREGQVALDQMTDAHGRWLRDNIILKMVDVGWARKVGRSLDDMTAQVTPKLVNIPKGQLTPPISKTPKPTPKKPPQPITLGKDEAQSSLGKVVDVPESSKIERTRTDLPRRPESWTAPENVPDPYVSLKLDGIPKKMHDHIVNGAKRVTSQFPVRINELGGSRGFSDLYSGLRKRNFPRGANAVYTRPSANGFGPDFVPGKNDHIHLKTGFASQANSGKYGKIVRESREYSDKLLKKDRAVLQALEDSRNIDDAARAAKLQDIDDALKGIAPTQENRLQRATLIGQRGAYQKYNEGYHESLRKTVEERIATKRWTISDELMIEGKNGLGIEATVAHEYGHAVMFQHAEVRIFREKWSSELAKNGVSRLDRLGVSKYGATSDDELFAEIFSAWAVGRENTIPTNVWKAFIDTMKIWRRKDGV